ncbi:UDP-N-acetylmuramoyl-tripeptide--D-alanyl-D-alanine ligase [Candidatus Palibaumannia cicadellinicola]|uniref:UDP-N-acetylmuramoyl-tripeptide--D-alanyl-D-alanine ligase n=1 Tax=Candidatus Palibaumannia cicadellinicola TaxID=186490 RepID=A0A088MYK0_9GAMM|nr:UDP-N-acetylmuramoyl-tripeptide--D-alanyl-D-alanine ligase [Candidatus Baumannia cicadellinicola]AIN47440.1 UDP-N-acetylmuramoylalanyl-D-glutamyl-2,6- diaminopimelate--D-alanyl-D-alanine ligase [Candidatus Baumannia cicadellinicola]
MISFLLHDIAPVLNAQIVGLNTTIQEVTTDSRAVGEHCMFIALQGERFDAHHLAQNAVLAGACAILVSYQLPLQIPQLIVKDTRLALGKLGAWVRQQVPARIVALTGSSGKTSVKEMTASILRQCGKVLATQGNFNNDIGVALTLLRLTPKYDFAVIELGANHIGEIAWTTGLVRPETALVNNISAAHLAGFGSIAGVSQAKGEIFTGLLDKGIVIINADSNDWSHWQQGLDLSCYKQIWRFALDKFDNVDFFASEVISDQLCMYFTLHSPLGNCRVRLPLLGRHNIANALAASALSLSVGATLSAVAIGLAQINPIPGRLFPIKLGNNMLLLDDSYNANVSSMIAATEVLAEMPGYRVMAVGDMAELGDQEIQCHKEVGKIIAIAGIDKVLSVGRLSHLIGDVSKQGEHFQDKSTLTNRITQLLSEHKVITVLVKGSRNAAMEHVVQVLQEKKNVSVCC